MSQIDNSHLQGMWIFAYTAAGLHFACFIFLLAFAIGVDLPRRGIPLSLKSNFSTSQTLLLSLQLSAVVYQLFKGRFFQSSNPLYRPVYSFWYAVCEVLYLFFSWTRSSDILKGQYSLRMYRIFLALLYLTPVTCLLPSVLKFCAIYFKSMEYERYVNIGHFMSGGVVTATDLFFAFAFYSYLVKFTKVMSDDSSYGNTNGLKLQTIAIYGLVSSCFCFFALAGVVSVMIVSFLDPRMENPYSRTLHLLGYIVVDIGSFVLCLTPILMKVRLHQLGMQAAVKPHDRSHGLEGEGAAFMQKQHMSSNRTNADSS